MPSENNDRRKTSGISILLRIIAGIVVVICFTLLIYRPDRPVATITPGSSSEPTFVVQVIRPRLGLPLGGLLPPQVFGLEANLTFNSTSPGATVGSTGPRRIELAADNWEVVIVLDDEGRVSSETHAVFELMFEDRLRQVRCFPADPPVGTIDTTTSPTRDYISGSFDIELARCEDAVTGEPLGWPPKPLVLHGSFDRLTLDTP